MNYLFLLDTFPLVADVAVVGFSDLAVVMKDGLGHVSVMSPVGLGIREGRSGRGTTPRFPVTFVGFESHSPDGGAIGL
jgi:hypothetical protein